MSTALNETGEDWGDRLLASLASKARLAALTPTLRLDLVWAVRTIAAHKSWAYQRAVRGVDQEKGGTMLPRLAQAVAMLHFHMVDINGIPMRTDAQALDRQAHPLEDLPSEAEKADIAAPVNGHPETTAESSELATQQQLF